ncbi:hypothetical protein Vretifemale_16909 [Volvox reticuliferus]|nr:hypothetical protein Vretifemale_16909 [Volvox reticuliferus]
MADLVPLSCLSSFPSLDRLMSCRLHDAPTQTFRPSFQSSRGGSGGGGGGGVHGGSHGTITHRSIAAGATRGSNGNRNQAHRPEPRHPQPRFAGNSLPGVGASASAAAASANALRTSFGRIDALRRDGIVPASAGPITPHSNSASHSHFRNHVHAAGGGVQSPGSPTLRALPTAIPSRVATTTPRRRNRAQQPTVRQWHGLEDTVIEPHRNANPVLDAIAAVTAEAYTVLDAATGVGASPITVLPLSPSRATATMVAPPPALSPTGGGGAASTAITGGGGGGVGPVGGSGPPPRALISVAAPGGSVVMLPEGVDPVLAQAVLRDAVTWDTGVTFDDIAGCDRAKQLLHEAVALPLIIPEFFTGIREPWRGVLLHGPPGNGKTMLAKALAGMVGGAFFAVSPASLTSKWRGESEKLLATLFAVAQAHAPAIIFIDEVDALGGARGVDGEHEASRRFKAELLQQMDGLASGRGVMVLAATNCPWDLDPALRRRLEKRIHIGLPDAAQRLALLQLHLRGVVLAPNVDLPALAASCEGFSGADIRLLCRDAAMAPLRRQIGNLAVGNSCPTPPPQQHQLQELQSPSAGHPQLSSPSPEAPRVPVLQPQSQPLVLRSAADIRRLADSGELARGAVVSIADLEAARGSVRRSVTADQAARYVQWDQEFAST